MVFYHVSSYRKDGDILDPNQKMSLRYLNTNKTNEAIYNILFNAYQKNFSDFVDSYKEFCDSKIFEETGRCPNKWLCEVLFESVREDIKYKLPSRLKGIFLCDCYKDAIEFRDKKNRQNGTIFRVIVPDGDYQCFDMNLFTKADNILYKYGLNESTYKDVIEIGKNYWNGCEKSFSSKEYIYDNGPIKLEQYNEA